jgi:hypothetical protein
MNELFNEVYNMKYLLLISLLVVNVVLLAVPVSREQAVQAAMNWTSVWAPQQSQTWMVDKVIPFEDKNVAQLYLVLYKDGFVLTSADDSAVPILAYGYDTDVSDYTSNPSWLAYVASLQAEINQIRAERASNTETALQWQQILSGNVNRDNTRSVSPLLFTRWNQNWPYNMLCPADAEGPGGRVYAGCVATAMGQVMKYWNWPVTGTGSHTYYAQGYGSQSANFGNTTYQWAQMPNAVHEANDAVARLLYHCGISVDMMYAPDGSGAYSADVVDAWIQYFRYNPGLQQKSKYSFSSATWEQMLRTELDNARPMYYSGFGPAGGHAFVCDGYQGTNYFHFNWGWSGSFDGYYYVSNLNPGTTFNNGQAAIFDVYPVNYSISSVQLSMQGADCTVGDATTVSLVTYPLLPDWDVTSLVFSVQYDDTYMNYLSYETAGTMLEGAVVTATQTQPGLISFTVNSSSLLSGGGTLLKLQFQPLVPGSYAFSLASFSMNGTAVTLLGSTTINAGALIAEMQDSVIDLLNSMHIAYDTITTVPLTTTFILPTWNVSAASFNLNYNPAQLQWEGWETAGCLTHDATVEVTPTTAGVLHFNLSFSSPLVGTGNLLKLKFRSIGNTGSVSLATLTVSEFYFNQTAVLNLQPGYVVLLPVTSNEDGTQIPVNGLKVGPNPFSTSTRIRLSQDKPAGQTEIGIYNLKGQLVKTLFKSELKSGNLDLEWNGTDYRNQSAPEGLYLVRVKSADYNKTIRIVKLK